MRRNQTHSAAFREEVVHQALTRDPAISLRRFAADVGVNYGALCLCGNSTTFARPSHSLRGTLSFCCPFCAGLRHGADPRGRLQPTGTRRRESRNHHSPARVVVTRRARFISIPIPKRWQWLAGFLRFGAFSIAAKSACSWIRSEHPQSVRISHAIERGRQWRRTRVLRVTFRNGIDVLPCEISSALRSRAVKSRSRSP